MNRESPEEKKARLFAEAIAAIGDGEITKLSEKSQGALEIVLKFHIDLEVDYKMEANTERDRATIAGIEKAQAEGRRVVLMLQLYGRGSIDVAQDYFFPSWLNSVHNLSLSQKWTIALFFKLNPQLAAFIRRFPSGITAMKIGKMIESLYDGWAETFTHKRSISLPTDESGWNEIYWSLGVVMEDEKYIYRILIEELELEGSSAEDEGEFEKELPVETGTPEEGYAVLDNVNEHISLTKVKEFLESKDIIVKNSMRLMDTKTTPSSKTNMIAVFIDGISKISSLVQSAARDGELDESLQAPVVPKNLRKPRCSWELLVNERATDI